MWRNLSYGVDAMVPLVVQDLAESIVRGLRNGALVARDTVGISRTKSSQTRATVWPIHFFTDTAPQLMTIPLES